ncbi:NAD-P-binding protein [Vararia minispora EC-137]|uniref:NAD-P-binding protein n=1 Tax=Vararia minispora EC-137 TaxID=1314806 RepID=A0ACB8QX38_9AGAM|nr:NAD-P-binding protein [Vararia minispora EC-137]
MGFVISRPSFDPRKNVPSLQGRIAVVTGADTGIGFETADQLVAHGAKVYLACVTEEKAKGAKERIELQRPNLRKTALVPVGVDLSSIPSIQSAAQAILSRETKLDLLVNNAGRLASDYVLNEMGIEMSVAVNHVGPFVFTKALLPLLRATAALPGNDVRIISLSSASYEWAGAVDFTSVEGLNNPYASKGAVNAWSAKFRRYGATKLMIILFVRELQRRLDEEGVPITCMAVHPGQVGTAGCKEHIPFYLLPYAWLATLSPFQGAFTSLFAATSPQVFAQRDQFAGRYLVPFGEVGKLTTKESQDAGLSAALWKTTEALVKTASNTTMVLA